MEGKSCETPGCDQPAKLQCPTCIKLGIQGSFFCSQECFKSNWDLHKTLHKLAKTDSASQSSKKERALERKIKLQDNMIKELERDCEKLQNYNLQVTASVISINFFYELNFRLSVDLRKFL